MSNILLSVDETQPNAHTMESAIDRAERDGGHLVVVHAMPTATYESRKRSIGGSRDLRAEGSTYTLSQARADAETVARRAVRSALDGRDVPYVAVGAVGKVVPTVLATAAEHDCDTVVRSAERSWWRRLLGGSDRGLTRRFDGTVVQVPRSAPVALDPEQVEPSL